MVHHHPSYSSTTTTTHAPSSTAPYGAEMFPAIFVFAKRSLYISSRHLIASSRQIFHYVANQLNIRNIQSMQSITPCRQLPSS
jgi:hypothetical protein